MPIASKQTKTAHHGSRLKSLPALALAVMGLFIGAAPAVAAPILGSSLASFAVLAATGVTSVAPSTIGGNLGSAPNPSIIGGYVFTAGSAQPNTVLAQNAQLELDAAILAVNAMGPGLTIGSDLTGIIFPGIYTVPAAATNLSGNLILDGGGSNSAFWAFLFPSTLITSSTSNVFVTNVGDGANVGLFWSVGSAATLDGFTFAGNVLAQDLISSDGNLTITCGRLLSSEKQVTLNQDTISIGCAGTGIPGATEVENSGGFNNAVPEPGSLALLGLGLAALGLARRRHG